MQVKKKKHSYSTLVKHFIELTKKSHDPVYRFNTNTMHYHDFTDFTPTLTNAGYTDTEALTELLRFFNNYDLDNNNETNNNLILKYTTYFSKIKAYYAEHDDFWLTLHDYNTLEMAPGSFTPESANERNTALVDLYYTEVEKQLPKLIKNHYLYDFSEDKTLLILDELKKTPSGAESLKGINTIDDLVEFFVKDDILIEFTRKNKVNTFSTFINQADTKRLNTFNKLNKH